MQMPRAKSWRWAWTFDDFYEVTRTSPLIIASRTDHLGIVRICIDKSEPCPNKQVSSRTLLTVAAADPALRDYEGKNLSDCTCEHDEEPYIFLLRNVSIHLSENVL